MNVINKINLVGELVHLSEPNEENVIYGTFRVYIPGKKYNLDGKTFYNFYSDNFYLKFDPRINDYDGFHLKQLKLGQFYDIIGILGVKKYNKRLINVKSIHYYTMEKLFNLEEKDGKDAYSSFVKYREADLKSYQDAVKKLKNMKR